MWRRGGCAVQERRVGGGAGEDAERRAEEGGAGEAAGAGEGLAGVEDGVRRDGAEAKPGGVVLLQIFPGIGWILRFAGHCNRRLHADIMC